MENLDTKKTWSKEELIICYYISKWGIAGLAIEQEDIVSTVIKDATLGSFKMQVANFNFLLGIDARQLKHVSKLQIEIVENFKDLTITQVRKLVLAIISEHQDRVDKSVTERTNSNISAKMKLANKASEEVFQNKLKSLRRYQNLVPVNN